jgi:hypothetical protein
VKKIWAISEGAYSDYGVVAVFEREEDAQDALSKGMGDDIEEISFFAASETPAMLTVYIAEGFEGEMGVTVRQESWLEGDWNVHDENVRPPKRPKATRFMPVSGEGRYLVKAVCGDRDAAIKSVKDRLAAAKA